MLTTLPPPFPATALFPPKDKPVQKVKPRRGRPPKAKTNPANEPASSPTTAVTVAPAESLVPPPKKGALADPAVYQKTRRTITRQARRKLDTIVSMLALGHTYADLGRMFDKTEKQIRWTVAEARRRGILKPDEEVHHLLVNRARPAAAEVLLEHLEEMHSLKAAIATLKGTGDFKSADDGGQTQIVLGVQIQMTGQEPKPTDGAIVGVGRVIQVEPCP